MSAENPLGVDSAPPRSSWKLRSEVRGAKQTAWQVLVASTAANLAAEKVRHLVETRQWPLHARGHRAARRDRDRLRADS